MLKETSNHIKILKVKHLMNFQFEIRL